MSSSINKHVAFFFSLTFSHFLSAQPSIAILDFQGKGVSEIEASALTDRLASELFNLGRFKLIEREQMNELLEEQGFQQTGCVSSECAVEVGMMVGAEQIVTGSISKIGDLFSVATRIVDVETGEILQMTNYDFEGDIGQLMTRGMRNAAAQLTTAEYFTQEVDIEPTIPEVVVLPQELVTKPTFKKATYITDIYPHADSYVQVALAVMGFFITLLWIASL